MTEGNEDETEIANTTNGCRQGVKDIRIFLNSDDQGRDGSIGWAAKIMGIDDKRHADVSCEFPF